jgi:hypothetical protein
MILRDTGAPGPMALELSGENRRSRFFSVVDVEK